MEIIYRAEDGTEFSNYHECELYEEDRAGRRAATIALSIIGFVVVVILLL